MTVSPEPGTGGNVGAPPRSNPYVGLVPFGPDDVGWFFGRDREQRIIGANLRASRLTLLYGASGVGKSSVLMAAVVPSLREVVAHDRAAAALQDPALRQPVRFAVSTFSAWRDAPLHGLMEAVAASVEEATGARVAPWKPGTPLRDTFAAWLEPADTNGTAAGPLTVRALLIVVDQFEEYFLYHPHEDGPGTFAGEFVEVLNDPGLRVNFLISLREDGLAKLDRFQGRLPRLFDNYLRVGHLDHDAARLAIVGPLEKYNSGLAQGEQATISEDLIEKILTDVRTKDEVLEPPGAPVQTAPAATPAQDLVETPLLQLVMQRLWAAETSSGAPQLTVATLTEKLGGTERIIHRHLEEALTGLPAGPTAAVLRTLISPAGTKIAGRAGSIAFLAKLQPGDVEPILERLASGEKRILRKIDPPATEADQSKLYELFHDILADPVVKWCSVREGEEQEREHRKERHNRTVKKAALGLAALAVCLIVAVAVAINSRQIASSRALAASATAQLPVEPERGLLLAMAAMHGRATGEAQQALRRSLAASRVRARLREDGAARPCLACGGLATPASGRVDATAPQRVALAPDGRTVAAIVGDRLRLWNPRSGTVLTPAVAVGTSTRVAFTADAKRLLVVGDDGAALMAPDGTDVVRLEGGEYRGGATSPDGGFVATLSDRGARVWDARSGDAVNSLPEPADLVFDSVAFAGPGRIVIHDFAGGVTRWHWSSKARQSRVPADPIVDPPFPARYSARARFAVESSPNANRARVVAASGRTVQLPSGTDEEPVEDAVISPDGTRVALRRGADVELWRSGRTGWHGTPRRVGTLPHTDTVDGAVFSADSRLVGTASTDGTARVWESATGDLVAELQGHTAGVSDLAFSANGRFVVSLGEDLTTLLWDLGRERTLRGEDAVEAVLTSAKGSRVVVVEDLGKLKLWDTRATRPTPLDPAARAAAAGDPCRDSGGRLHPTSAALAANDRSLLVGYGSADDACGRVILRDIESRRVLFEPSVKAGAVRKVAMDPLARSVAIVRFDQASLDTVVELFDVRTRRRRLLATPRGIPTDVAFSPDGTRLLTTDVYGGALVFDVASARRVRTLAGGNADTPGPQAFYRGVFSPDGKTIAVAGSRGVQFWDSATGQRRALVLSGHTSLLRSVAYRRDGKQIVTAGADGTARVWDARSGTMLAVLTRHAGRVSAAAFLEDGSIVSGGDDRAVRVYRCETCGPADTLLDLAGRHVTRLLPRRELAEFGE